MKTIIVVLFGLALLSCSNDKEQKVEETPIATVREEVVLPTNYFLGCWEEKVDSVLVYWCFDSTQINRSGYIHPYSFREDTMQVSTLQYLYKIEENNLLLFNLLDSTEISLSKSNLTESPDVF